MLERILAAKREEVRSRQERLPAAVLEQRLKIAPPLRDFAGAISSAGRTNIRLIAEFKRASPSRGVIRADLSPADVGPRYEKAGAAAISVLTDGPFFSGSLEDLREVRAAVSVPLLRKDFILDAYQLLEAREAGADAVLLIAAALSDKSLDELNRRASAMGLAVIIEVHDRMELDRALSISPRIVGINNRDLRTFKVDLQTTLRLRPLIPAGIVVVSESGISSRADVLRLQTAGVDAVLVGEYLMRDPDPGAAAARLLLD